MPKKLIGAPGRSATICIIARAHRRVERIGRPLFSTSSPARAATPPYATVTCAVAAFGMAGPACGSGCCCAKPCAS